MNMEARKRNDISNNLFGIVYTLNLILKSYDSRRICKQESE